MVCVSAQAVRIASGLNSGLRRRRLAGGTSTLALAIAALSLPLMPGEAQAQLVSIENGASETVDGSGGGTQPSPWNIAGSLAVGDASEGTLSIINGGQVNSQATTVGFDVGGIGTVTVTGTGSILATANALSVGQGESGELTIADGGLVESGSGLIANFGTGKVTVTGNGSRWVNQSGVSVGAGGHGELLIEDGGEVTNGVSYIGLVNGSSGEVTVTGDGSNWDITGNLDIGLSGTGTLAVEGGGAVTSSTGAIGTNLGSTGQVAVTGADSSWNVGGELRIGALGEGTLTVRNGGKVVHIDHDNSHGLIGAFQGGAGDVTVTGAGSDWTAAGYISVGAGGHGTLTIADGGTVTSKQGTVGQWGESFGEVLISGAGSTWTMAYAGPGTLSEEVGEFYLGAGGEGKLTISHGGALITTDTYIGNWGTGTGTANVTGPGSEWRVTGAPGEPGQFNVGYRGSGTVTVSNGGTIRSGTGIIGRLDGSDGSVKITGPNSQWINEGLLRVGLQGRAELLIEDGGYVSSLTGRVGPLFGYGEHGEVTVIGTGSHWEVTTGSSDPGLSIGYDGQGTVTLTDGGKVTANQVILGEVTHFGLDRGIGTLNIGSAAGDTAAAAGVIEAPGGLIFGNDTGTLVFNHTDGDYIFGLDIARSGTGNNGPLTIHHQHGTTTYTGDGSAFTGTTNITGGTLNVTGSLGGNIGVSDGGLLGGTGALGAVTVDGGTLAPGMSAGTLQVESLILTADSILAFELGMPGVIGGGVNDLIIVDNGLTLDGVLNVTDLPDFGNGLYTLIQYGSLDADNGLELGNVPSDYSYGLDSGTGTDSAVTLAVSGGTAGDIHFWDGFNTSPGGVANGRGGSGLWNATNTNWTDQSGSTNSAWGSNFAIFGGTAGTVTVEGAQDFTGMQFLTSGYEIVGGTDGELVASLANTNIRVGNGVEAEITAPITGAGGLVKQEGGTLILAGDNDFAGETRVLGGTLRVQDGDGLGDGTITVGNGTGVAELDVVSGGIVDGKSITVQSNAFATLGFGSSALGAELNADGGRINIHHGADITDADLIASGDGEFWITFDSFGPELRTLNTIGGDGAIILGGNGDDVLEIGSGTFAGVISDAVNGNTTGLTKIGSGRLTLTGQNTYTGLTTIEEGSLYLEGSGTLAGDVHISEFGQLKFNNSSDVTYGGSVSGGGFVTGPDLGSARITFTGDSSDYSGAVGFLAGNLHVVQGAVLGASSVTIQPAATLSGAGEINANVNLFGHLSPGDDGLGTLTIAGSLTMGENAQLHYDIGAPGTAGSPGVSDLVIVGGNLTLDGELHLIDDGEAGIGHYRLMTYGGSLTDNTLDVAMPGAVSGGTYEILSGGGNVDLVISGNGGDPDPGPGPGPVIGDPLLQYWQDASATWTAAGTDWRNSGGDVDVVWAGNHGVFNGDGGIIAVEGTQGFLGLQFVSDGYVLAGSGALQTDAGGSELRVLAGETATIETEITGTGGITKTQGGTLILAGTHSYAGSTTVAAGTLRLAEGSELESSMVNVLAGGSFAGTGTLSGGLSIEGGTLAPGNSIGTITVGSLALDADSVLEIEVHDNGDADKVIVNGGVSLGGATLAVLEADGVNFSGTDSYSYVIIENNGGTAVDGTFGAILNELAFLEAGVDYAGGTGNDVVLKLGQVLSFPDVASTFNQAEAARALAAFDRTPGSDADDVYTALLVSTTDQALRAFDSASGEIYASLLADRAMAAMAWVDRMLARAHEGRGEGWGMWLGGTARSGHLDGDDNAARLEGDSLGAELGIEYRGGGWAVGAALGYVDGDVTVGDRRSRGDFDGWTLGGYARFGTGNAGLSASVAVDYASLDLDAQRQIGMGALERVALASTDLESISLAGELRYGFALGSGEGGWALGALGSVRHAHVDLHSFAETGAGSLDLASGGATLGVTRWGGGAFLNWQGDKGYLELTVQYVTGEDVGAQVSLTMAGAPSTLYYTRSPHLEEAGVLMGATGAVEIGGGWSLGTRMHWLNGGKAANLATSASIALKF